MQKNQPKRFHLTFNCQMWPKAHFDQISKFHFLKFWQTNSINDVKVQAESFHLNGHIIGIRPQTQKLELPHKSLSNTLAVIGLKGKHHRILSTDCKVRMNNHHPTPHSWRELVKEKGYAWYTCTSIKQIHCKRKSHYSCVDSFSTSFIELTNNIK